MSDTLQDRMSLLSEGTQEPMTQAALIFGAIVNGNASDPAVQKAIEDAKKTAETTNDPAQWITGLLAEAATNGSLGGIEGNVTQSELDAEIHARQTADAVIDAQWRAGVAQEAALRAAGDAAGGGGGGGGGDVTQAQLQAEAAARIAGDAIVTAEWQAALAEAQLGGGGSPPEVTQSELDAERDARIAGDTVVTNAWQAAVTTEASARQAVDAVETVARTSADTVLSNRITTLEGAPAGGGWTLVSTEAQLRAAEAAGNDSILLVGDIQLTTGPLEIIHPGVRIYGRKSSTGQRAKLSRQGVTGVTHDIVVVKAPRVELHGLEMTANNPLFALTFNVGTEVLNPSSQQLDYAVMLRPTTANDVSDFVLQDCYIHHVSIPVKMESFESALWADRMRIIGNRIESFNWYGIYLDWNMRALRIEDNWIWGRAKTEALGGQATLMNETHAVPGNAIWLGNRAQRCLIRGNDLAQCDRHGAEIWMPQTGSAVNANDANIITENVIHDFVTPAGNPLIQLSMGISVTAGGIGCIISNNQIQNTTWYGIEIFSADGSPGSYIVEGNSIKDVIGLAAGLPALGISINSCTGARVVGNYIENVRMQSGNHNTIGISIVGGNSTGHSGLPSFDGVTVSENELVDAGCFGIAAGGEWNGVSETGIRRRLTIKGNTIHFTAGRQHRPAAVPEVAVWVSYCGSSVVVKDNEFFYPLSLPPAGTWISAPWTPINGFDLIGYGTVYESSAAPIVGTVINAQIDIMGDTNLSIGYRADGLSS